MSTSFESVLAQYEKKQQAASGNANKVSQEDRMKKFFTPILPKGSLSEDKRIRILPTKDGSSPFVEVFFHELVVGGQRLKLYDPAQEGKRSPLNEVNESLRATGVESDKELAKSYRSRKFYIVKVIDRDNEQDGPKFWRFKDAYKNDGVLDKIFPIWRNKGDIADPITGRDLILTLSLTKSNNGNDYTSINAVMPDDPSPLHKDEKIANEWMTDELIWSDLYSKKSEDYLEMIAKGETPKWDFNLGKWVSNSQEEATVGNNKPAASVPDPQETDEVDDDLPF